MALLVCINVVLCFSLATTVKASETEPTPTIKLDKITSVQQNAEVARLLREERFAELESYARDLISRKARFADGSWRIYLFINNLSDPYASDKNGWKEYIDRLVRWRAAFPDSAISQTALGEGLFDWAVDARGEGYADKVTDEGWQQFKERLARAQEVLKQQVKGPDCPMLHTLRFRVAFLLHEPEEVIEKNYADARAAEPQFYYNILYRAQFLQPKWGGQPGELGRLIRKEMAGLDKPDRESFMARFAGNMVDELTYKGVFTEFPWNTLKPSFEKLVYYYNAPRMHNYYLRFACFSEDYEAVLQENKILADKVELVGVWSWGKRTYENCIEKAKTAIVHSSMK
ncbi:DUF4034 domain-containing protein [Geomonas sp. Red32]|uniref:DUF4034 domain-containing protein n=1 Tax=Geomonas sp. Red32 TaxID=2912856 RepID=UPI00202CE242|nr:DUF4034 domain-containing protein [Geomonas sp. Red32]